MITTTKLTPEQQRAILYWPEVAGIPIFPANTRSKEIHYSEWQKIDFLQHNFRARLGAGEYDHGIAIRLGKTLSGKLYSFAIDLDGWEAVQLWFGKENTWDKVLKTSEGTRVEWHGDKGRLHILGFSKEPIPNKKIYVIKPEGSSKGALLESALLEIRCENQPLFVSPSIHLEGKPYTALGTEKISVLDSLFRLKSKINSLCENYMSDEDLQAYVKWLEDPANYSKLGQGQGRHNGLVTLGTSYYYRYNGKWKDYTDEQRKAKLRDWNMKLAVPKSEKEFNDIWKWIVDKHRRTRNEQHEKLREKEKRRKQEFDKTHTFSMYSDEIKMSLEGNVWTEIAKNPVRWIIADSKMKVIYKAHQHDYEITVKHDKDEQREKIYKLSIDNTIIRCIPTNITKHESPLDFLQSQNQTNYTMPFIDTTGSTFTLVRKTIEQIMDYLKDNGYVMSNYGATEALSAIITAFREDGKLQVEKSVDFEGYYYCDGDIQRSGVENKHPKRSREECIRVIDFLEKWSGFYIYNGIDRRDIVATAIKWAIIAPYNFAIKQLTRKYMNGISFSGERDGGKSAMSEAMLEIHGNFTDKSASEQSIYDLSAGSANTDAKFGNAVSHTTYPVAFSEFGRVENYGRDEKLVETFKNAIDRLICRHGRQGGRYDFPFLSLSPLIINGNPFISRKGEILKRLHTIKYSQEDRHDKDDPRTIAYNGLMQNRRHELRILGDWTINYIWDSRHELLLSKKYDAYQLMNILIRKFYEFAGVEFPEWLDRWIMETSLEELDIDEEGIIRAILFNHIHEVLRQNAHLLDIKGDGEISLENRLRLCLEKDLLSFIRKKVGNDTEVFDIDSSILMLFEARLPDMTLKRLGEKMGLNYHHTKQRWVLRCSRDNLWKFLL